MKLIPTSGKSFRMKTTAALMAILFLANMIVIGSNIAPVKADPDTLSFKVTSADIIAGVDAMNQWLVDNGMDTFGGANMPAEARIPGQTIMSLVHSTPQRFLGDFWLYPYDPWAYFGGESGNPALGFDTWTSVVSQDTNVGDWVSDTTYWYLGIPFWYAEDIDLYPGTVTTALIPQPGSSADEFYFTIDIDPLQADAEGKFRFLFSGESFRDPPIGGSDISQFIGYVDLAPLGPPDMTVDLLVGQTTDVGSVTISFSGGDTIHVTFTTDVAGWYLTELHVDVQDDSADIPQTKNGNPKVGKFAYQAEFDSPTGNPDGTLTGGTTTYTFDIPFTYEDDVGFTVYVAAQAEVEQWTWTPPTDTEPGYWTTLDETGWGDGTDFTPGTKPNRSWAMYIEYGYTPP